VGIGSDIHKIEIDRELIIGGVNIPFDRGLDGHSDADVLTHSIIDAMLGAASLGDIGQHFPASDERWLGISSLKLLMKTTTLLKSKGCKVINIDSTVIAENPPLPDWIPQMIEKIASILDVSTENVSIKATTSKGIGPIGAGEAISALSVVLIDKPDR
jgi:2-C-methyl-D-erythritol 2,4-cyclodiphosphate synthase